MSFKSLWMLNSSITRSKSPRRIAVLVTTGLKDASEAFGDMPEFTRVSKDSWQHKFCETKERHLWRVWTHAYVTNGSFTFSSLFQDEISSHKEKSLFSNLKGQVIKAMGFYGCSCSNLRTKPRSSESDNRFILDIAIKVTNDYYFGLGQ
jgi:hypothetical protein